MIYTTTAIDFEKSFLFNSLYWDMWGISTSQVPTIRIPEHFCSIPYSLQQNWCRTMERLEQELSINTLYCLHCKIPYSPSDEYNLFRRYKVCSGCISKLLREYNKNKREFSFSDFVEYKKVLDVLAR